MTSPCSDDRRVDLEPTAAGAEGNRVTVEHWAVDVGGEQDGRRRGPVIRLPTRPCDLWGDLEQSLASTIGAQDANASRTPRFAAPSIETTKIPVLRVFCQALFRTEPETPSLPCT